MKKQKVRNMTFIEAAIKCLENNNNVPLSANEMWDIIKTDVPSNGKTPWASLSTILLDNSINTTLKSDQGKNKNIFQIVGNNPMKFRLFKPEVGLDLTETKTDVIEIMTPYIIQKPLYQITSKELNWKILSVYSDSSILYNISDCSEYTYIMEDKAHATIKIGKTKNDPESRLSQLKTANPSISLLHVFPSIQYSEKDLHIKFEDYRKDLEWFFYTKGIKDFLKNEIELHNIIIESYNKRKELDVLEKDLLNKL